jgi:hypothetical protein
MKHRLLKERNMCTQKRAAQICTVYMLGFLCVIAPEAQADTHSHSGEHGRNFHGSDFSGFTPKERSRWQGGHWVHDWHDGRFAWWWMVDGFWYFYPEPIYPYPTYVPPAIVVQQPPPVPAGFPPAPFWYFCSDPEGYYPYVASCSGVWREIPATPPAGIPQQ